MIERLKQHKAEISREFKERIYRLLDEYGEPKPQNINIKIEEKKPKNINITIHILD